VVGNKLDEIATLKESFKFVHATLLLGYQYNFALQCATTNLAKEKPTVKLFQFPNVLRATSLFK